MSEQEIIEFLKDERDKVIAERNMATENERLLHAAISAYERAVGLSYGILIVVKDKAEEQECVPEDSITNVLDEIGTAVAIARDNLSKTLISSRS